jgi:hypothetical protein
MTMSVVTAQQTDDATSIPYFDPGEYLINVIRRAKANRQDLRISAGELGEIDVLTTRGRYFTRHGDLSLLCKSLSDTLQVTVLSPREQWSPPLGHRGGSLCELMWEAGFHASQGRLMEGCSPFHVVELARWPNLTRLSLGANTVRLCALLTRHPTSVVVAGRLLKIDKAELYQFYTAATCAGVAHPVNRTNGETEEPELDPFGDQGLLAKLVARIARL